MDWNKRIAKAMEISKYESFEVFMKKQRVVKSSPFTHTSFKGGKYYIQSEDYDKYLDLYQLHKGASYGMVENPKDSRYVRFDFDLHFIEATKISKKHN